MLERKRKDAEIRKLEEEMSVLRRNNDRLEAEKVVHSAIFVIFLSSILSLVRALFAFLSYGAASRLAVQVQRRAYSTASSRFSRPPHTSENQARHW